MSSSPAPPDLSALLAAERLQAPPPGSLERDIVKLAEALSQGVEPLGIGAASLQAGSSLLTKVAGSVAVGAVIGASAAGGAYYASSPAAVSPATPVSTAPQSSPTVQQAPLGDAAPAQDRALAPVDVTRGSGPSGAVSAAPPDPREAAPAGAVDAGFDAELELIELAKKGVDSGQPHLASVWLAEHARRYPDGVFVQERRALQALVACAQHSGQGPRLAAEFIRMYPGSAFLDRVRRACQGSAPGRASKNFEGDK